MCPYFVGRLDMSKECTEISSEESSPYFNLMCVTVYTMACRFNVVGHKHIVRLFFVLRYTHIQKIGFSRFAGDMALHRGESAGGTGLTPDIYTYIYRLL